MESNIVLLIPLGVWDFDRHVDCKIAKRPPSEGAAERGGGGDSAAPSLSAPTGFMPALAGAPLKITDNPLPELKIV